jgi:hypothetical protein
MWPFFVYLAVCIVFYYILVRIAVEARDDTDIG